MTDPQHHDAAHEGPIKTPKQLIWTVLAAFAVPITVIVLLANFVNAGDRSGAGSEAMSEQAVALRIQPVGAVVLKDASVVAELRSDRLGAAHQVGPGRAGAVLAEGQGRDGSTRRR